MGEGRFAHHSNYFEPRRVPGVLHIDICSGHYPLPACIDWSAWYAYSRVYIRDEERGELGHVHKHSILWPFQVLGENSDHTKNNYANNYASEDAWQHCFLLGQYCRRPCFPWINSSLAKSLRRRCRNVFIIMMLSFSASPIQKCLTMAICFRLAVSQRRFLFPASVCL